MSITKYLNHCSIEKKLSSNTVKAYRLDMNQFQRYISNLSFKLELENVKKNIFKITLFI